MTSPSALAVPNQGQGQEPTFSPSQNDLPLDLLSFIGGLEQTSMEGADQGLGQAEQHESAPGSVHGHDGPSYGMDGATDGYEGLEYAPSHDQQHSQQHPVLPHIQTAVGMGVSMSDSGPSSAGPSTQPMQPPLSHSQTSQLQDYRSPPSGASHSRRASTEIVRQGSARGRTRVKSRKSAASTSNSRQSMQEAGMMELDQSQRGQAQMEQDMQNQQQHQHGALMEGFEGEFDPSMLHHQLESIHMQSPLVWAPNGSWPDAAQAFFTNHAQGQARDGEMGMMMPPGQGQKWNMQGGLITPGPSGSMFPQMRTDKMSPMHLEMLAKARAVYGDVNNLPLLSPALSHEANSTYTSPAHQVAFNDPSTSQASQYGSTHPSPAQANRSPLEQLQEQQRQFQEQLLVLQEQQKQLQATAAAVAASASTNSSPYVSTTASAANSGNSARPVTTPGVGPHGGFFSPLTSPALEASASGRLGHFSHAGQGHHYSPSIMTSNRAHPLSALSSPALNPVGTAGGGQQTLSPALGPHMGNDGEPDYLAALSGYMDAQNQNSHGGNGSIPPLGAPYSGHSHSTQHSPILHTSLPSSASISTQASAASAHGLIMSPITGQNPFSGHSNTPTSAGPHRTLNRQSRPSPMMKPTVRTNSSGHIRQANGGSAGGQFSMPSSPVTGTAPRNQFTPVVMPGVPLAAGVPGMGHMAPAAIDQRGVLQAQAALQAANASTPSTPSPVDLSHMMPPPPVPNYGGQNGKGVVPLTPASLMNLGGGSSAALSGSGRPQRKPTVAASPAPSASSAAGPKRSKLAPAPQVAPGKRGVPSRPAAIIAARTSKAAAAALQAEGGETRKTSHKAAEQKRRDSLKAGFDELRLLLPPINTEALDPESGEPIPGSSAPRLLPKSSLVPDDNPNRGVSKVALLKFSNEYIVKLMERVAKRDDYIERLKDEVRRLRLGDGAGADDDDEEETKDGMMGGRGGEGDLLDEDMREGEDDFDAPPMLGELEGIAEDPRERDGADREGDEDAEDGDEAMDDEQDASASASAPASAHKSSSAHDRGNGTNGTGPNGAGSGGGGGPDKWGLMRRRSGGISRVRRSVAAA